MQFPPYTTFAQRFGHWALWLGCGAILIFFDCAGIGGRATGF